jgi:hypothetical protein
MALESGAILAVCTLVTKVITLGPIRENEERWKELCELAAKEQDPEKLIELTRQINSLLLFKQKRIDPEQPTQEIRYAGGEV